VGDLRHHPDRIRPRPIEPQDPPQAISVQHAVATLAELINHRDHRFLVDTASFVDNPLVPHVKLVGHRQVTDAHLISIARQNDAQVVSFDEGMTSVGGGTVRRIDCSGR